MNSKLSICLCLSLLLIIGTASQMVYAAPMFSFKIGSFGTANEQLKTPNDVIVSSDGNTIYVVDAENHRINVFDDDGDHDFKFGSFCDMALIQNCNDNADGADNDGDGQFNNPTSGVLDSFGHFFVVDSGNERIQRFDDGDGEFELKFGSSDNTESEYLGNAQGVSTLKSTREIYVSSIDTDSISVFDSSGQFLFNFDSFDGNDSLRNPSHMIIDDNDETLYVSDSGNDRIIIFKLVTGNTCPSGTSKATDGVCFVKKFGSAGTSDGKFDSPSGLALDTTNDLLYVADSDNNRIQIFKLVTGNTCTSGTSEIVDGVCFIEKFGSAGTSDGKFDSPSGLALDTTNGLLYVADTDNNRLQAFTLNSTSSLVPSAPKNLKSFPLSPTSIILTWDEPTFNNNIPSVTGYKIEYKIGSTSYTAVTADTKSTATSFIHEGLDSSKTYSYQVSAINSKGISNPSTSSVKPAATTVPGGLIAAAISPTQIKLSWQPPSNTFGQSISGYDIQKVFGTDAYATIGSTNGKTTSYIVSNLETDKTYSFAVSANIGAGSTEPSNTASATPRTNSVDVSITPTSSTIPTITIPTSPIKLTATSVSSTQINLSWSPPPSDGNSPITGYKIEVKKDSGSNSTLVADTKSTATTYSHTGLITNSKYTYKVYAINSVGTSTASNEVTATPVTTLKLNPLGKLSIDEGKSLSFAVKVTDNSLHGLIFSLDKTPPIGAKINSNTGMFTWTPTDSQGAKSYIFDIVVTLGSTTDRQSITIIVNDVLNKSEPIVEEPTPVTKPEPEPTQELGIASFVDKSKDPQSYIDRYNKESTYKKWFDTNFPEYSSIYQAVGLDEPKGLASFVDPTKDPQSYVNRYNNESTYKKWFDTNFPEYSSIYEAVGLDEPKVETPKVETPQFGICGTGTKLIDGVCTLIEIPKAKPWWKFW